MGKLFFTAILGVLVAFLTLPNGCSANWKAPCSPEQPKPAAGDQVKNITWRASYDKDNVKMVPGSVQADFGGFNFQWVIYSDGTGKLVTWNFLGAGELPPVQVNLYLLGKEDGTTVLFRQWAAPANHSAPAEIRPIVTVKTEELFSVFDGVDSIPVKTMNNQEQGVKWEPSFKNDGIRYISGAIAADYGRLSIYWKIETDGTYRLFTTEALGAGELSLREVPLYLWHDRVTGITVLCQERKPLLNQGGPTYLWPLVSVKTSDLMEGINKANY